MAGEPNSPSAVTPIGLAASQVLSQQQTQCKKVYEALCANNDLVSNIHFDSDTDFEELSKFLLEQLAVLTTELREILAPSVVPMLSTA